MLRLNGGSIRPKNTKVEEEDDEDSFRIEEEFNELKAKYDQMAASKARITEKLRLSEERIADLEAGQRSISAREPAQFEIHPVKVTEANTPTAELTHGAASAGTTDCVEQRDLRDLHQRELYPTIEASLSRPRSAGRRRSRETSGSSTPPEVSASKTRQSSHSQGRRTAGTSAVSAASAAAITEQQLQQIQQLHGELALRDKKLEEAELALAMRDGEITRRGAEVTHLKASLASARLMAPPPDAHGGSAAVKGSACFLVSSALRPIDAADVNSADAQEARHTVMIQRLSEKDEEIKGLRTELETTQRRCSQLEVALHAMAARSVISSYVASVNVVSETTPSGGSGAAASCGSSSAPAPSELRSPLAGLSHTPLSGQSHPSEPMSSTAVSTAGLLAVAKPEHVLTPTQLHCDVSPRPFRGAASAEGAYAERAKDRSMERGMPALKSRVGSVMPVNQSDFNRRLSQIENAVISSVEISGAGSGKAPATTGGARLAEAWPPLPSEIEAVASRPSVVLLTTSTGPPVYRNSSHVPYAATPAQSLPSSSSIHARNSSQPVAAAGTGSLQRLRSAEDVTPSSLGTVEYRSVTPVARRSPVSRFRDLSPATSATASGPHGPRGGLIIRGRSPVGNQFLHSHSQSPGPNARPMVGVTSSPGGGVILPNHTQFSSQLPTPIHAIPQVFAFGGSPEGKPRGR